jgi:hypothetical protein
MNGQEFVILVGGLTHALARFLVLFGFIYFLVLFQVWDAEKYLTRAHTLGTCFISNSRSP